ncbi:MAG: hypothetical protein DME10_16725 [Candidatus Rokuibacteriota bacterium]|nr:MAG: hypothetical protein DME10_16725 [Candidatus Rokubacteria bacterium]
MLVVGFFGLVLIMSELGGEVVTLHTQAAGGGEKRTHLWVVDDAGAAWVRAGLLAPRRGRQGRLEWSFQDLLLLKTTKGLLDARIPMARIRRMMASLKRQLPDDQALSPSAPRASESVPGGSCYWITLSARCSSDWGTVRPSAFAAFMLITNSNVVACSIGSSPGLAPLRILST